MATSLDQNFSSLASILMQRRQMQMQEQENAKQNQLRDLQFKQLQREDDYQTGLAGAMSNPQPSLSNLGPTQPMSPYQAGAEYAASKGRVNDVVKLLSVDDQVAQLRAKGDLQGYYQAQKELEEGGKFFDTVNKFKNNPQQLEALWPQIQRMFPQQSEGITPASIKFDAEYTIVPLVMNGKEVPDKGVFRDAQGKTSIVDLTPKPDQEAMIDKRFENQRQLTQMQIEAADRRAAADRAAADKRAAGKGVERGKLTAGYRWAADGVTMEPIPGGPADQGIEKAKGAYDTSIAVVDKLLAHPGRKMATGKSSLNPLNLVPGTQAYDFNRELESFDANLFLSNIEKMKGMGALSNAEGAKVSAAAGAIRPGMSEAAFEQNLKIIKAELAKAKQRLDNGGKLPAQSSVASNNGKRPPLSAIFGTKR